MSEIVTQPDIAAARAAYEDASGRLAVLCRGLFVDGQDATDSLLSLADEVGAAEAVSRMLENAEQFGELSPEINGAVVSDLADTIEDALDAAQVAQDRLDLATSRREAGLRSAEPGRLQVINIAGRDYVIDASRGELRAVDNPTERYELGLEVATAPAAGPSLTEQARAESGALSAEPKPDRGPARGR